MQFIQGINYKINGVIYEWFVSFICKTQVKNLKHIFYDCSHTTKLDQHHIDSNKKLHELPINTKM